MANKAKSIELLNRAVADELSAVHQYMYFHFHCDDQGYDLLALLFKQTAIEEMLHIERLAERILFLKGEVEIAASAQEQALYHGEVARIAAGSAGAVHPDRRCGEPGQLGRTALQHGR